jgi:hypothetical protein
LKPTHKKNRLDSVRIFLATLAVAAAVALALGPVNADRTAGATAVAFATSRLPQAHWYVAHRTFEPWASNVVRGSYRVSGLSAPAWVIELNAPADASWKGYTSVVIINAGTGAIMAGDALVTN